MSSERYIGDGVCVRLERGRLMIISSLQVGEIPVPRDWIALEPTAFTELLNFAAEIGWGALVVRAANQMAVDEAVSDEEYARDEEDKQRKRDAAEDFDED